MFNLERKTGQVLVLAIAVTFLLVSGFSAPLIAQEDESETVGIGEISELMRLIGSSEGVDEEALVNALAGLSEAIKEELEAQGVPEDVISNFEEETNSAFTLFSEGLLSKSQFGDVLSRSTNQLAQDVEDGFPVELLEENGINTEAIQKLKEGAETLSGPEVAEIARSIAGKREEKEEGQGKGEEKREEASEKGKSEGEDRSENSSDNSGRP